MQHIHIHGYPVALAAIAFVAGVRLWSYKKGHRLSAWFFGAAAFGLAIGFTPWTDALASLVATGTGLTVLLIVDVVSGFGFYYEAIRKHMHHRIVTPLMALAFGTALLLTIGSITRLLAKAAKSPSKTSDALGSAVSRIQSGRAAHAVPHGHALTALAIAGAFLMVLIVLGRKFENRKSGGSAAPAITARPSAGRGAGRALPIGRGKR